MQQEADLTDVMSEDPLMKQVMSSRMMMIMMTMMTIMMTMMIMMTMIQTLEMRRLRGQGAGRPGAKISVGSMSTDITDIGSSGTGFHMHTQPV